MIFNMNKPSKNMLLSTTQLQNMYREQQAKIYEEDQSRIIAEQAAVERERESHFERLNSSFNDRINENATRAQKLVKIKESLISECLFKLYCESIAFPMTSKDKVVGHNLINKFITENGAGNIINSFSTKNLILSEFSRISNKYYNKIIEGDYCDPKDCGQIQTNGELITKTTIDDFYKELEDVNTIDASKAIKDRVADAISEFIDTNTANRIEYEDIINQAKDKVASIKGADDTLAESYINMAKRKINEMKNARELNIFGYMVESLTTSVIKDESLKARYVNEGAVDMDSIVNSVQLIYTMLEMVNTLNMVNVNEEFISKYTNSL